MLQKKKENLHPFLLRCWPAGNPFHLSYRHSTILYSLNRVYYTLTNAIQHCIILNNGLKISTLNWNQPHCKWVILHTRPKQQRSSPLFLCFYFFKWNHFYLGYSTKSSVIFKKNPNDIHRIFYFKKARFKHNIIKIKFDLPLLRNPDIILVWIPKEQKDVYNLTGILEMKSNLFLFYYY